LAAGVKISWPEALRLTLPLGTATAAPPAVMAVPFTAVMLRPAFSKESLASTLMVTGVSSLVVAVSPTMSVTALTMIGTVSTSDAAPSVVVTVKVAVPL
jgi:hypothetical protein